MVKKVKKSRFANVNVNDSQLAAAVKESAQHIWLAGLGAFARAQQEGNKVYETLVKEGNSLQKKTRSLTEDRIGEVTGKMNLMTGKVSKMAEGVSKQATESWDRLETVFEDRVARALTRLGVPSNKEVQALIKRVDELNAHLVAIGGKPAAKVRRSSAAKKPAARKMAKNRVTRAKKVAAK